MLLVLYLGGQLKPNNANLFSEVKNKILYEALQRNNTKNTFQNIYDRNINLISIAKDRNKALHDTNTLLKQIELLARQDIYSFFNISENKNKFVEDMKLKYELFEKLGVFKHE